MTNTKVNSKAKDDKKNQIEEDDAIISKLLEQRRKELMERRAKEVEEMEKQSKSSKKNAKTKKSSKDEMVERVNKYLKEEAEQKLKEQQEKDAEKLRKFNSKKETFVKIFKKIKPAKLLFKLGYIAIVGSSGLYITNTAVQEIVNKVQTNEVNKALDYYGGISEYMGKGGFFNSYTKFKPYNTKNIRIGLDASVDEITETQLAYCVNYLNSMFDVINPDYHLNMIRADENNCDIFMQVSTVESSEQIANNTVVGVTYDRYPKNFFSIFQKGSANITFNSSYTKYPAIFRFAALHEFEHVLLDNSDLSFIKTEKYNHYTVPYSVLSYPHFSKMSYVLEYPTLYSINKNKDEQTLNYLHNEFVSYTPFDLAAYAARYGNLNDENNKKACTQLIVDTYKTCKEVFGEGNKYFLDDTELNNEGYPVRFEKYTKQNTIQSSKSVNNNSSLCYGINYTKVKDEEEKDN